MDVKIGLSAYDSRDQRVLSIHEHLGRCGPSLQGDEGRIVDQRLREIEDLLSRLAAIDPTLRAVVEMRAFEGLSREEIASRLGCSVRTVARHWEFAKRWLQHAMTPPSP